MCPCEISECLLLQFCSMSCRDTARRVRRFQRRKILLETFRPDSKNHRAGTKRVQNGCLENAAPAERSWRGVLRGHVPSKSPSADGEIPRAHTSGHRSQVGEKSDSFSRAERTRPLRPVCRLQYYDFENIPVECFQRGIPFLKPADTPCRVRYQNQIKSLCS